ncbi:tape measure protein [Nocardia sp. NPDC058705]|uniref:tape measure protein n=1 Tax=Nocardia sp. NPDC058705 TaxID=3346609 RepID=UPI00367C1624
MGSQLAGGIGAVFKKSVAGIGVAAGAVLGTALSQGFGRMVAIDDAKGKLAGLGHEAEGIATIMASANAAVKGTAFGMGEAATAAASAVAAGIKQGEDLTNYLKLIGDTATIAGTDLASMGAIFNKVQTSGKAYTDDLNMLSDRGIPIMQLLAKEYGVSAEALSKMVKDGKVDAVTFRKVLQDEIGGAGLESGKTLRGSWKNMQASLGRIGEAALSPFLDMSKSGLAGITAWADKIKPHVAKAAQYVADGLGDMGRAFQSNGASVNGVASNWERVGTKARGLVDKVRELYGAFQSGGAAGLWEKIRSGADKAAGGFGSAEGAGSKLSTAFGKIASAGASISESLVSLAGDTGTVAAQGIRGIGSAMAYLADHSGAATTAMVGFAAAVVAAKAVHVAFEASRVAVAVMMPAQIASQIAMTRAVTAQTAVMRAHIAALGGEAPIQALTMRQRVAATATRFQEAVATRTATSALGQYALAQRTAAASSGALIAASRNTAAAVATVGARATATATTAFAGLRTAGAGLAGMLGGPLGIAIMAAGAGLIANYTSAQSARDAQNSLAAAVVAGAKAQSQFALAVSESNGALNSQALSAGVDSVKASLAETIGLAERGHTIVENIGHTLDNISFNGLGSNDGWEKDFDKVSGAQERMETLRAVASDLKMDLEDVWTVTTKGGPEFAKLTEKLQASGDAGKDMARELEAAHAPLQSIADAAKNSTPGVSSVTAAIKKLASESSDADDSLNALKQALDAISGKPVQIEDALQSYNDAIRSVTDSTKEAWDATDGFGSSLIDSMGGIDTTSANGSKLRSTLIDLRDETLKVAAAGGDLGPVFTRNEAVLADLARATGLSAEQMKQLAESAGYVPSKIEMLIALKGATEAKQDLVTIRTMLGKNELTIDTKLLGSDQVIREIQAAGGKVEEVVGKPGVFRVEAPNVPSVISKVDELLAKINALPNNKTVKVTYQEATASGEWRAPMVLPNQPRARGGPIFGAGGPTSDSIPALLSSGEHVWTAAEVAKVGGHEAMYSLRSLAKSGGLKFAEGGTPWGIDKAITAARSVEGNVYDWGGTEPTNFDCSGFVGWLQQIAMGVEGPTKRLYTTMSLIGGSTSGLEKGLGPAGTWLQVGVSNDHMAGTLAGLAVESGGAHGTSGIGGSRAKATDSQFPFRFHLPNELIKGYGSLMSGGKVVEWTAEDERELERARIAVTQAKERRDEIYSKSDSTDSERRLADLDVTDAEAKVIDKQKQKDKQGTTEGGERIAPQAPALTEAYNAEKAARIDRLQAVEEANTKRNEVYDDPYATDLEKAKADQDLALAQQENNAVSNESKTASTLKDVFTTAASGAAGALFDAAKEIFLPDTVKSSHWWDVADEAISLANTDTDEDGTSNINELLSSVPSFNTNDIMKQLGFNGNTPDWAKSKKDVKVFDNGGWLEPGQMGINLSSRPEPIFNSPSQLAQFAGSTLTEPQGMYGANFGKTLERMADSLHQTATSPPVTIQTDNLSAGLRAYGNHQKRAALVHQRR